MTEFAFLQERLARQSKRKRVVLACPHDSHTEYVITRALDEGWAEFCLTTYLPLTKTFEQVVERHRAHVTLRPCQSAQEASREAVMMVWRGEGEVLMKGTVNTDVLLREVLNKEHGLLEPGKVLTHIAVAAIPSYPRMLLFSDAAVIPRPTVEQFDAILTACVDAAHRLGVARPHVALTHCTEKVSEKFPHTLSYQTLIEKSRAGVYGDAVVDGPMDVKTAIDAESGAIKGICSEVTGQADILLFPNIESGNTFYKTITFFAHATIAGWLAGTTVPIVVASRADSELSKYYSLALSCLESSWAGNNG